MALDRTFEEGLKKKRTPRIPLKETSEKTRECDVMEAQRRHFKKEEMLYWKCC